jgi:hypothetical protein
MSHFLGFCFGSDIENNLEQYDENLTVESYVVYTKDEAIDLCKQNTAEEYSNAVQHLKNSSACSDDLIDYYQKIVDRGLFVSYEDAWERVKKWGYEIDENENLISSYNPNSKWDWYEIGGRWNNFLPLKIDNSESKLTTNAAYVKDIDWEFLLNENKLPFCYIDEEGDWHEKGEICWFGMIHHEKESETWKQYFTDFIKTLDDNCLVTVIDFHI